MAVYAACLTGKPGPPFDPEDYAWDELMIFLERQYILNGCDEIRLCFHEPICIGDTWWKCIMEIHWPGGRITRLGPSGADKMDALLNAMALAKISLTNNEKWKSAEVTWLGLGAAPGLDVPDLGVQD